MIDKNQLMQVSNIVLSYVLDLNESDVEALIEGNKVIKLAQKSQKVKEEQLELELEVTKLKEPKKINKKSNKKAELKKVDKEEDIVKEIIIVEDQVDIVKEIIIVEEQEEINLQDNCDEVTEDDIINETINKIKKFKSRKEASSFLNEKRFTVKILNTIAKKSNIYVKCRSKREVIIEKIINGIFGE